MEFDSFMYHDIPVRISIPQNKQVLLQDVLSHDDKEIVPFYCTRTKKEKLIDR